MGKYTNHTLVDLANEMHLCLEARMYAESLPGVLIDLKQSSYVYIFYGDQGKAPVISQAVFPMFILSTYSSKVKVGVLYPV